MANLNNKTSNTSKKEGANTPSISQEVEVTETPVIEENVETQTETEVTETPVIEENKPAKGVVRYKKVSKTIFRYNGTDYKQSDILEINKDIFNTSFKNFVSDWELIK